MQPDSATPIMGEQGLPRAPAASDSARPSPGWWAGAGIGRRLLLWIVLASSLITLLLTSLQLYLDYRRDVEGIEARLAEIERGYLPSLAGSLWKLDREQLQTQLDGIAGLPDMLGAQVEEAQGLLVARAGRTGALAEISRRLPLVYLDRGERRVLGVLHLAATLEGVYQRLAERALIILASQAVKTFLVSLFILFIVHQIVTRHLRSLAQHFSQFRLESPAGALQLARRPPNQADEIDQLVAAFAALQERLQKAYADLRLANASLEQDVAARRLAEQEVTRLNQELEERVRQRTTELESANRELGAFTYSVSHDLRAPLRAIHGFTHLVGLESGDQISEQARQYLARVQAAVERMESLIDDLLRLSQVSQRVMKPERVDLSAMAAGVAREIQAGEFARRVEWVIEPDLVATGDAGLLRIVLENLLGNAWKYSGKREAARIEFGYAADGENAGFFVRDNGVGFDMRYAERLFVAFHRLHSPAEFPGTGIGLATVSRIIHRHGGRIWAEGKVGEGACFCFSLGRIDGN